MAGRSDDAEVPLGWRAIIRDSANAGGFPTVGGRVPVIQAERDAWRPRVGA